MYELSVEMKKNECYPDSQRLQHPDVPVLHGHEHRPQVLHVCPVQSHLAAKIIDGGGL